MTRGCVSFFGAGGLFLNFLWSSVVCLWPKSKPVKKVKQSRYTPWRRLGGKEL
jgi:hypothetical protein